MIVVDMYKGTSQNVLVNVLRANKRAAVYNKHSPGC